MLPTKGYFQDIECPYFDDSCGRPYCHFRHRKKQLDSIDDGTGIVETITQKEVPTYKPTPKSELAVSRSHIPISYIPDNYRPGKTSRSASSIIPKTFPKLVYKPTPISLLNSAIKNDDSNDESIDELKNCIASTKYSPKSENVTQFEYKPTSLEDSSISENIEKHEYKPMGESSNNIEYKPTALDDIDEHNSSNAYKPTSESMPTTEYKPSANLIGTSIDFENLDSEFDMIDEIINMTDKTKPVEGKTSDVKNILMENNDKESEHRKESKQSSKSHKHSKDKEIKPKNKNEEKVHKNKNEEKNRDKKQSESFKDKKYSSKSSNDIKNSDKNNCSKEENKHEDDKHKNKDEAKHGNKKSKDIKIKDERRSKEKCSSDKSKSKHESKSKEKEECRNKDKEKIRSKSKEKSNKDSEKSIDRHEKHKHNKGDKKEKIDRHKNDKKKSSSQDKSKHKSKKDEKKSKHGTDNNKVSEEKINSKNIVKDKKEKYGFSLDSESDNDSLPNVNNNVVSDIDISDFDDLGDDTMMECFKIFNEYKPNEPQIAKTDQNNKMKEIEEEEEQIPIRKRIAHSNTAPSTSAKFLVPKPKSAPTPGEIMNNRFKAVKAMQAENEQKLIMNEVNKVHKRPAEISGTSSIDVPKKPKLTSLKTSSTTVVPSKYSIVPPKSSATAVLQKPTSLIDDIINGHKSKLMTKKIAPVANVMNIQRAKAQFEELNKRKAVQQLSASSRTIAQTTRDGRRQAHVPEYSLSEIPDVLEADKSKLPVNVRTRFLTLLAEECCKLYVVQNDAYKRALDEEYSCYQKCKVLVTYRNSAMLAVNRIRKEVQERDQNDLGPIGNGGKTGGKAKENSDTNSLLYKQIERYVLTEEELDVHGYPRESATAGKAVIKNRKSNASLRLLPKNQKKCSRCSKIYLVNDNGAIIYEEECLYHPLKKRTIRGEQIYLCCKTSDDFGCVTSHTHVSEMSEEAELEGFQTTMAPDGADDPRSSAVYALDCEMCYTTKGLELTRVTIVDTNCKTVYESLVKPLNEIIDFNTRFSGITKQQMDRINTGILQVQANILHLCNSKTILIGHSLESDMKALKIVHGTIVDTSVLFPHKMGLPHKRALRMLASDYLKKIIQNDVSGHDSAEDAITCMELVKWKIKEDSKFKFGK